MVDTPVNDYDEESTDVVHLMALTAAGDLVRAKPSTYPIEDTDISFLQGHKANGDVIRVAPGSLSNSLARSFVATGAITADNFVALNSDGTVEVVTGTETLAAIGTDNTSITALNSFRYLASAYNATSAKIALLYYDLAASNTIYVVIGTVSGTTISWGTPATFVGGTGATYWTAGKIVWNAAGTSVIVAFYGATGYPSVVAATISGTTPTFGSVVQDSTGTAVPTILFHDDTHGTRVIFRASNFLYAATYSGTTVTLGTREAYSLTDTTRLKMFYDATNTRFVGVSGTTTTYVKAGTVSGTTWTVGSEASSSSITYPSSVMIPSTGSIGVLGGTDGSNPTMLRTSVVTFSGATSTINTPTATTVASGISSYEPVAVYDATSGKILFAASKNYTSYSPIPASDLVVIVGTVSSTTMSLSNEVMLRSGGSNQPSYVFARSTGSEIAIVYDQQSDFNRTHIIKGKIDSGVFVEQEDMLMRSIIKTDPTGTEDTILAGWQLIDFNHWGTPGASATLTCFAVTLPTEDTNADDWIGIANSNAANGEDVSVIFRGGLYEGLTGLTIGQEYFLKGDGTLITTDNGRRAGIATATTSLLMEVK